MEQSLSIALKEWATVCDALKAGRQIILLRKGGIQEAIGGFELEHRQFLLFPTYLHQNVNMLKPEFHALVEPYSAEPEKITLSSAAEVTDIVRLKERKQMDVLDAEHIWTSPLIDMRFNYRPANPLYLLIVRAYTLDKPVTILNTPEYAGCKSWVPLERGISAIAATAALNDDQFEARRAKLLGVVES